MEVEGAVEVLENSNAFKQWKEQNKEAYLVHAFMVMEKGEESAWQLGYYKPDNDKMVTFTLGEKIEVSDESEIFKKDDSKIEGLDIAKVKFSLNDILKACQELQKEKYPEDKPARIIAILQVIKEVGQVWNVTYLTGRMNTLNMKVRSDTKKVVFDELKPIMDLAEE